MSLSLFIFNFMVFNRTGLPVWLLTRHLNIPSTILRWQVLACVPAHPVSYPQWPSVHILSTISFGSQGSSCPWEKKNPSKHSECCAVFSFPERTSGILQKTKQNKTKGHPCHHPWRLKPEDLACGLVRSQCDPWTAFIGFSAVSWQELAVGGNKRNWKVLAGLLEWMNV